MPEDQIFIKDADKTKCSLCHTTLHMSNKEELLICNSLVVYMRIDKKGKAQVKCRTCKTMNIVDVYA